MGFTKLDDDILDSSIWDEHANVLKVFIAFWKKSNADGIVSATYNAMYRTANLCDEKKEPLPIEVFDRALTVLLSPDPASRCTEKEGRRIIRLEESKWFIVTYKRRREFTYSDKPDAVRKREYRASKNGTSGTSLDTSQSVPGHSKSNLISSNLNLISSESNLVEGGSGETGGPDPMAEYEVHKNALLAKIAPNCGGVK
jgi:hypothetical protein